MRRLSALTSGAVLLTAVLIARPAQSQEPQTVFGGETDVRAIWGLESRLSSIQGNVSATWGFFGGVTLNDATAFALTLSANLTHPDVNYSYFGLIGSYAHNRDAVVHSGANVLFAVASTKDYAREKSSLFDNFGNTTGEGFYFVEPTVFGELNLTRRFRLRLGLGYRIAWALDETTAYTTLTGVTADDFSGLAFTIAVGT
jgi:hypothetical protein